MKGLLPIFSLLVLLAALSLSGVFHGNGTVFAQQSLSTKQTGCLGCHTQIRLDSFHALTCTVCHQGKDTATKKEHAHNGFLAHPGHPQQMLTRCGSCHPQQVDASRNSPHFTLKKKVNAVRQHFGVENTLDNPLQIPIIAPITTKMALVDDMLRRRCLRCHVYSSGDDYPAVHHGTGCGACHLSFQDGSLRSHAFALPTDRQCLSCHHANKVGSDYYGRYQQDFHWHYRTPFTPHEGGDRPYGVQDYNLTPDIHQQRGLVCIDCHYGTGHGAPSTLDCTTCHGWRPGQAAPSLPNLRVKDDVLLLRSRGNKMAKELKVPALQHPAHAEYGQRVSCQVCHAQWSANDSPTHLLLTEDEDFNTWEMLYTQSSSEIERLVEHNLYSMEDEMDITMRDGLTGVSRPGVWLMGYTKRRWEQMIFAMDKDGVIKVFRPVLDLRLSMVNKAGEASFDNIRGNDDGLRPYTPHTTGPAGVFYRDRFQHLLINNNRMVNYEDP